MARCKDRESRVVIVYHAWCPACGEFLVGDSIETYKWAKLHPHEAKKCYEATVVFKECKNESGDGKESAAEGTGVLREGT